MFQNPIGLDRLGGYVKEIDFEDVMEIEGYVPAKHPLNPTKATPAFIKVLDRGNFKITLDKPEKKVIQFKGRLLKGEWHFEKKNDDWQIFQKRAMERETEIIKIDQEQRIITGIVLEPDVEDANGDIISAEEIEKSAYDFLSNYGQGRKIRLMHSEDRDIDLIESWIQKNDAKYNGKTVKAGTWLISTKVNDEEIWEKIKDGTITGFSVKGLGKREKIDGV